jgi:hypothetical protein
MIFAKGGLVLALLGIASISHAAFVKFDAQFSVNKEPGAPTSWVGPGQGPSTIRGSWIMDTETFDSAVYDVGSVSPASAATLHSFALRGIATSGLEFYADDALLWASDAGSATLLGNQVTEASYDSVLSLGSGLRSLSFVDARSGPVLSESAFSGLGDPLQHMLSSFTFFNVAMLRGEWGQLALRSPTNVSFTTIPTPATFILFSIALLGTWMFALLPRRTHPKLGTL